MGNSTLYSELEKVERIAQASKFMRMVRQPFKYFEAILYRELFYSKTKKEKSVHCKTFFGADMRLLLPSSTDIYLTGGKSHESEIRLARFMMNTLDKKDTFLDVGGHYGYFSLLASTLVPDGQVISFEASTTTYSVLKENIAKYNNIQGFNLAVSDTNIPITFYEFPNLYSEYNSIDIDQYKEEKWFSDNQPQKITIESVVLDVFLKQNQLSPRIIKIDVEGAEFKVLSGLKTTLLNQSPTIVMEFLNAARGNEAHLKAAKLLKSLNYTTFKIDSSGALIAIKSVENHLRENGLDSDNIAFKK